MTDQKNGMREGEVYRIVGMSNNTSDEKTNSSYSFYGAKYHNVEDHGTTHLSILSPAGLGL